MVHGVRSTTLSNGQISVMYILLRVITLSALLPGALADCFIDNNGFEQCNDGLSFGARLGIGIGGAIIFIVLLGILQYRRRKRLQKYYLSYLPPQGVPPPQPQPQPPTYYASYTAQYSEPYGAYRGAQQVREPSPQVVGVYSMYSVRVESEAAEPPTTSPGPRYPPNVYDGAGGPPKA